MHDLTDSLDYYRAQGAPGDQQMLVYLLREVQDQCGGTLDAEALNAVCQAYGLKMNLLTALIRRVPSLRLSSVPNRLEACGTCPKGRALRAFIEETWQVKSGGACEKAGFSYHVTGCMKNCKNGPSIRWNGKLHSHADEQLVRSLIEGQP